MLCINFHSIENRRHVMYNEFSDKGAHSAKWVEITKDFLKLAFAGDHRED
jgi:hypothetical protein